MEELILCVEDGVEKGPFRLTRLNRNKTKYSHKNVRGWSGSKMGVND